MIYTRYHQARAAKIAAECARMRREDAEIRGEVPAQQQATQPQPQQPTESRPQQPQQRNEQKRR